MKTKKFYNLYLRTRNFSCKPLKQLLFPIRVIYRMGSTTPTNQITRFRNYIELNTAEACKLSGDKILMKKRFTRSNIPTAPWFTVNAADTNNQKVQHYLDKWGTIIIKHKHSSKGNGIYLIKSLDEYLQLNLNNIENYIFEKYYTYSKEYRLHVTKEGCFYACRKMLKNDAQIRWHRHENNSVWILEDNPLFAKPTNWDEIVTACVNALKSLQLDIAAFDIKVQNDKHEYPKFIILESNSAPALGKYGLTTYKQQLTHIINENI